VTHILFTGALHRYPRLKLVSAESDAGWLAYYERLVDDQWKRQRHWSELELPNPPSEYVRRQIYAMYWFEQRSMRAVVDLLGDNLMFETDFPHATSLSPGPASESPSPRDVMERSLEGLPDELVGKILQHTATALYHLEPPARLGSAA